MNYSSIVSRDAYDAVPMPLLKKFLRQDHADDDSLLSTLLSAAALEAETYIQMALTPQTRIVRVAGVPSRPVPLDIGPVSSVVSITYTARNGDVTELDEADWVLDPALQMVYPADYVQWPGLQPSNEGVFAVVYAAGPMVTSPPTPLTADLQAALSLMCEALYTREEKSHGMLRKTAYLMLDQHREGQGV